MAARDATPAARAGQMLAAAGCSLGDVIDLFMAVLSERRGCVVQLEPPLDAVAPCLTLPHLYDPELSAWFAEATRLLPSEDGVDPSDGT